MFFKHKYSSAAKMSPRSRSYNLKVFWSFNENLGIFITYLLYICIDIKSTCECSLLCLYDLTYYLPHKVKVSVKVTKRQNLAQKHNLAHFKDIFEEFVKLMFTMFLDVHMRIFRVVSYMIDFLNCIQSGGRISKVKR